MGQFRPKRSKKRFTGEDAAGTEGIANLSSINDSPPDGRQMRRRMALAAGVLVVVAVIVGVLASKGGNGGSSGSSTGSAGSSTSGGSSTTTGGSLPMSDKLSYPETPSPAYELVTRQTLDDIQSTATVYKHTKSGMQVVAMIPRDPNEDSTFGINFRTPSEGNDGAQYVVENSVLSGSVNYPVKDPINQLRLGSLQTYSASWTRRDRTSFVVASRNLADYRNNVKVLIDAVFHPLFIDEKYKWIYRREGWRLEFSDDGTLYINGNAFMNAKVAQMEPHEVMVSQIYQNLFADHVYSNKPKGEASEVVTLTYQEVIAYYNAYYHPSNGQAFCYGQQEYISSCLDALEPVLDEYEASAEIRKHSEVDWQDMTKIDQEKKQIGYPSYAEDVDFRAVVAWVLNDEPMDLRTEVAWHLINQLLVGSSTSPIPKAIVDADLGDDVIGYFENGLQQWVMALGVSGIETNDKVDIAREAIIGKLTSIVSNGFPSETLAAALNKMEFKFRDQSSPDMPLGAKIFNDLLVHWNYDRDPLSPLHYSKAFLDLKNELMEDGQKFLVELITKRMFDSQHTTYLDMYPSRSYADQWAQMETKWLDELDTYVSDEQGTQMMAETAELKDVQATDDSDEVLAKMPRLQISDLDKKLFTPPLKVERDLYDSGVTALEHELPFTNGIAYVDFAIDISSMDFDDVVLLPLFCSLLLKGGSKRYNDVQMQDEIDKASGGIKIYPIIEEVVKTHSSGGYVVPDGKHLVTKIVVSGACVAANSCLPLLNLFKHILWDSDVRNQAKAIEILEVLIDDFEDDIQSHGHKYTTQRIASRYSLAGFVREQWSGITQIMQMRRALALIRNDFTDLSLRLIKMQDAMTRGNRNGMVMSITGDSQSLKDLKSAVKLFITDVLPPAAQVERFPDFAKVEHPWVSKGMHRMGSEVSRENANQALMVPTRVNHVGKGGLLYEVGERIKGSDEVATQYLSGYYLYDRLRFDLGAQEGWAVLDTDSGLVIYQSDRDPNILETVKVFEGGSTWIWDQVHNGEMPVEGAAAVVGTIGRVDGTAMKPDRIGIESIMNFLKQNSAEDRQRWRDEIIGSTSDDFMAMAERLATWGDPSICVVTSVELYEEIKEDLPLTICDYYGFAC